MQPFPHRDAVSATVSPGGDVALTTGRRHDEATRLLRRAEQICLITNSLKASCHLDVDVRVAQAAA
jgi:hypothetical protein